MKYLFWCIASVSLILSGCPTNTSRAEVLTQETAAQSSVPLAERLPADPSSPGWVLTSSLDDGFGVPFIATDVSDNIYTTGWYSPPVEQSRDGIYKNPGCYVGKLDPDGNDLWTLVWTPETTEDNIYTRCIAVGSSGDIFVAGIFEGSIDFDPTSAQDIRTVAQKSGFFLSCFSPDGKYLWTRCWGGGARGVQSVSGMAFDDRGDLYIAGVFFGNVDFDPGPSEDKHNAWGGAYLLKLDGDGQYIWARTWGDENGSAETDAFAIGPDGDICVAGTFRGTVDLDPSETALQVSSDTAHKIYLSKFTPDGALAWARVWGGEDPSHPFCAAFDVQGDIYAVGWVGGSIDFDPGPGTDLQGTPGGPEQSFMTKYDRDGAYQWTRTWGGTQMCYAQRLVMEPAGRVLVLGRFDGSADFDPDPSNERAASSANSKIFLSEFGTDGSFLSVTTFGGAGGQGAEVIVLDHSGHILLAGEFTDSLDLRPFLDCIVRNASGTRAGFLCKVDRE